MTGLKSLHEQGAVHQYLKPENILLRKENDRLVAFLGDVGIAKHIANQSSINNLQSLTSRAEIERWIAPEMRNPNLIQLGQSQDKEVNKIDYRKFDVFSLGLISLYCLDSSENFEKYYDFFNEKSHMNHEEYLPQLKSKMPIEFFCLLKSMLSFDWNARPSIDEIYEFTTVYLVK
jgi:serine/threonine protein kinase